MIGVLAAYGWTVVKFCTCARAVSSKACVRDTNMSVAPLCSVQDANSSTASTYQERAVGNIRSEDHLQSLIPDGVRSSFWIRSAGPMRKKPSASLLRHCDPPLEWPHVPVTHCFRRLCHHRHDTADHGDRLARRDPATARADAGPAGGWPRFLPALRCRERRPFSPMASCSGVRCLLPGRTSGCWPLASPWCATPMFIRAAIGRGRRRWPCWQRVHWHWRRSSFCVVFSYRFVFRWSPDLAVPDCVLPADAARYARQRRPVPAALRTPFATRRRHHCRSRAGAPGCPARGTA